MLPAVLSLVWLSVSCVGRDHPFVWSSLQSSFAHYNMEAIRIEEETHQTVDVATVRLRTEICRSSSVSQPAL